MQPSVLHRLYQNDSTLSELFLCGSCMGSKGAAQLAVALKGNTHLRSLHLPLSFIGPDGLASLLPFLASKDCKLIDLNLADSDLGDDSCSLIAEVLTFNKSLQRLNLSDNEITDTGLLVISNALVQNSTLRTLSLAGNRISDSGLKGLCEGTASSGVKFLDLSCNLIREEGAVAVASAVASGDLRLNGIRLENNHIGDTSVSKLQLILKTEPCKVFFSGGKDESSVMA